MKVEDPVTNQASVSLAEVGKTFTTKGKKVDAVSDIVLDVEPGEYVVILGPSGCGKSTLIRCIAGLESPTRGRIQLQGRTVYDAASRIDVKANERKVGMVFQNYALWPHMTIEQNVAYPLKMRGVPKAERARRVAEVLKVLECEPLANRLPAELSGGQQQRIALARALVYEPEVLLLDEPLSNLDALLRVSLRAELLRLHRELGYTAVHITHDQEEALEMGDRVVLMREGRIEQVGAPDEVYARPVSPYAAVFLGVRNRLGVTLDGGSLVVDGRVITSNPSITQGLEPSDDLELFARGRDTIVASAAGGTSGGTRDVEVPGVLAQVVLGDGGRRQYVVDVNGNQWFAQAVEGPEPSIGEDVVLRLHAHDALIYRGEDLVFPQHSPALAAASSRP